ncbi:MULTISPECIES: tyrosine--tRNA ligase [Prochlorococcus]|uniref:Tyrosine--tRNA ligase n=1 Tax=Prochlorococcus marinus (strain SARG / CCMP1375 / SS120) TaxID=167539 RepID=SYY_PROMA|nr:MULTISPECIES: tyrosine--tRNA ligase [Prochlorococcus]Q7VAP7.1 RecName: Full=Tyrosine--tRNA ligase; AltName: Full=Tyrosyl-tRNA synthetase; Short=TyrRS [Prochlorococcus marinus subsp. marinus str. CCMP1375]AAQ00454.1 Tyrosyl-tRNA synthetase [Prochlorococcus marinus subsp. marinus str. CCMP1375]KGG14335.1 tyrosyl-tRNA synthetase [Prochlorococcus marinus str. LG]KGG22091.1 tyrosyl-tRNA synthetase [Prochlorococcus marinus str. SS2]KGG24591.1 tyrosyl-tRNA synthetase [Prochlorococcus marinus str. 
MLEQLTSLPDWLARGVADLFPLATNNSEKDQSLLLRLSQASRSNVPLRVKLGIDPTGSEIHLGHSIIFRKLRAFQDAGHTAILIIGDFTARIGDPTGKSKTRVQLSPEEVEKNSENYLNQLGKGQSKETSLLDFETEGRLEVRRNSEWLEGFDMVQIIDLLSKSTVGQMLAKEEFANRYTSGTSIALHEFLYPLFQGYDSVAVQADVELGGVDQKFNVAMGRDMQRHFSQKPQFGLLLPILVGLDGVQKMSKSLGNTVGLAEDALSMYSKLEKVPDSQVNNYLTLLTDCEIRDLTLNARELQKFMALNVTAQFHGLSVAKIAQKDASKIVSGLKETVEDVPVLSVSNVNFPTKAFHLLSSIGLCSSSSNARRQIQGGALRIDGKKILDPNFEFVDQKDIVGKILQLGKKTFRRISN